jgi:hypothetical protein
MAGLQRRYSVTGQTPPDHVGAMKSPKPRMPSKRSATQLPLSVASTPTPTPSSPSQEPELPTKIAGLGLYHDADAYPDAHPGPSSHALSLSSSHAHAYAHAHAHDAPTSVSLAGYEGPRQGQVPTFLTLPPEIRRMIYGHLPDLVIHYPLIYCTSTFANGNQHALASVCRLVRSEALAMFCSYNVWIIKLEFKMMYEAFQEWIIRLDEGAGSLRIVHVAVRGTLFKHRSPRRYSVADGAPVPMPNLPPALIASTDKYSPPDGDASFRIDLSERWTNGKVDVLRNDGTKEAGEEARAYLAGIVRGLWEKRRAGTLNGQDWVNLVDRFLAKVGWPQTHSTWAS